MESRWIRMFLFLFVIPVFLGTTLTFSSADEEDIGIGNEPNTVVEIRAFNNLKDAATLEKDTVGDISRARVSYDITGVTQGTRGGSMSDIASVVESITDRLVDIQPPGTSNVGWPRDFGHSSGVLVKNIYGLTGMGLLMAYDMTKVASYLVAAQNAGSVLNNVADPNLVSTDIVFLYGLSHKAQQGSSYRQAGLDGLKAFVGAYKDANAVYNLYDSTDDDIKQLKIWQLASWVEAAKLYGDANSYLNYPDPNTMGKWADRLMTKICSPACLDSGGFYYKKVGNVSYVRTAGQAKVVEVLKRFYSTKYPTELRNGLAFLRDLQSHNQGGKSKNGAFCWGGEVQNGSLTAWRKVTLQDQCYGIQAMAYNQQTTWNNYNDRKGTYWAASYLIREMLVSAPDFHSTTKEAFVDRVDYTPEGVVAAPRTDRNSEAIQALYYSCKEGDVGKNGRILAYGALQAVKKYMGLVSLNGPEFIAADRDSNGTITGTGTGGDASIILKDSVAHYSEPISSFLGK